MAYEPKEIFKFTIDKNKFEYEFKNLKSIVSYSSGFAVFDVKKILIKKNKYIKYLTDILLYNCKNKLIASDACFDLKDEDKLVLIDYESYYKFKIIKGKEGN